MPEPDAAALLAFFKTMANESRLRIIGLLSERERSVQELAELLELKEPTVSHHLAQLKALGLVSVRAEGVTRWHRLEPDALTAFSRRLLNRRQVAALAPEASWEERVMAAFVRPDGAFAALPSSRRKRWVLLRWLAEHEFEEGRRYPESEVNDILQRRHWDSATMRREMVGWRMLARESGVYWRQPMQEWIAA